jgi:hypothetical protein
MHHQTQDCTVFIMGFVDLIFFRAHVEWLIKSDTRIPLQEINRYTYDWVMQNTPPQIWSNVS